MLTIDIATNPAIAEISRCGHGARKSSPQRRSTDELIKSYQGLPDYLVRERWEVIEILRRVKKEVGLTDDLINHIEYIMKRIPVEEWLQGGCPVFYQSVINQAKELQITDRAIRYREQKLSDMGFLAFHDSGNGRRYPVKPNGRLVTAFGVSLIPLMMRVDELRQKDFEYRQNLLYWKQCRVEIAAIRRRITVLIDDALMNYDGLENQAVDWCEIWQAVRPVRSNDSLNVLEVRLETYRSLEDEILSVLSVQDDMGKTCGMSQHTSGTQETDFRHIDTNTESDNSKGYYCNTPEHSSGDNSKQSSPKGSQVDGLDVSKAHAAQVNASKEEACAENRTSKAKNWSSASDFDEIDHLSGAEYLSPSHIYEAACRDFRAAVDMVSNNAISKDLTVNDIKLAGEYLSSYLSISPYTWKNANSVLGRYAAAIGVMLSCRPHIKNAGAYLNGLITKHHKGQLNLHRSVFGQTSTSKRGRLN
jgi:replication initiation protein RepC